MSESQQTSADICIEMLKEHSVHIRRMAVWELGGQSDPRIVDHLLPLLDDPDWETRHYVIMALGRLGDLRAVPALEGLLDNGFLDANAQGSAGPAPREMADHLRQDIQLAIAWASGVKAFHEF